MIYLMGSILYISCRLLSYFLPNCFWNVGMLTYFLCSSKAPKPQITLQMNPAGLPGSAPQRRVWMNWKTQPKAKFMSWLYYAIWEGGFNSTATENGLKDDDKWRSLTAFLESKGLET